MKNIMFAFELVALLGYIAGMLFHEYREILWAFPAGFAAGIVLLKWVLMRKVRVESTILNSKNAPPEIKAKMDEIIKLLIKDGKLPKEAMAEDEKCTDPHCSDCWGLGDK